MTAVVIPNAHEPEHEVAGRLIELAGEDRVREVVALRGEHGVPLAFQVPSDLAAQLDAERAERWPEPEYEEVDDDNDPSTPPVRRQRRPGPAKE